MPNLKFNQLLLLSDTLRSARRFQFGDRITLISAKDNSVGKSTLVKSLMWVLGCEPYFDSTFLAFDPRVILDFEIDGEKYRVRRHKDEIRLKISDQPYTYYPKIGGDYSAKLAEILNFKARLTNRKDEVVVPPPAYYFVPFYMDQIKSWSGAWENFQNLSQFSNWKQIIINYHVGILTDEYFEYLDKISEAKLALSITRDLIKDLDAAYNVIENQRPQKVSTIQEEQLEVMSNEISIELKELVSSQEELFKKLAENQNDLTSVEHQISLTKMIVIDLEKDYKFAVENIVDDKFECPLCGVLHDNDIINRGSILTDKAQALAQLDVLEQEFKKYSNKAVRLRNGINEERIKINAINKKYIFEDDNKQEVELAKVIEDIASSSIQKKIESNKAKTLFEERNLVDTVKRYKKEQKDTITDNHREKVEKYFQFTYSKYVDELNTKGVNLSKINKPSDYNQIFKEGGAAEGVRAILAYYITIYRLINKFSNEVVAPLIIDTPNQHEQSEENYQRVISTLLNETFDGNQIIICAMDQGNIDPIKKVAEIISLNEDKIFMSSEYESVYKEFKI